MSEEFQAVITRKRFCDLVDIHASTLKRWERDRLVVPTMQEVIGITTATYTEADVAVARAAARLLREHRGTMSGKEAFQRARRQAAS